MAALGEGAESLSVGMLDAGDGAGERALGVGEVLGVPSPSGGEDAEPHAIGAAQTATTDAAKRRNERIYGRD